MGGLLEEQQEKSTKEIGSAVGSNLKQHPFHPVPNQNGAESKCFRSNGSSSSQISSLLSPKLRQDADSGRFSHESRFATIS
jgi:hypothetical protein